MNAIILAAGKSSRFAPFTYEKPKGLFRVKGEILIERQIEQLREAGVEEIYVVVGYMKEKFFYLEQKYPGLRLIVNNEFGKKGNLYTVYIARQYLADTFICCADHYLRQRDGSFVLILQLRVTGTGSLTLWGRNLNADLRMMKIVRYGKQKRQGMVLRLEIQERYQIIRC